MWDGRRGERGGVGTEGGDERRKGKRRRERERKEKGRRERTL